MFHVSSSSFFDSASWMEVTDIKWGIQYPTRFLNPSTSHFALKSVMATDNLKTCAWDRFRERDRSEHEHKNKKREVGGVKSRVKSLPSSKFSALRSSLSRFSAVRFGLSFQSSGKILPRPGNSNHNLGKALKMLVCLWFGLEKVMKGMRWAERNGIRSSLTFLLPQEENIWISHPKGRRHL